MVRLYLQRAFAGAFSALLALSLVPAMAQAQENEVIVEDTPAVEVQEVETPEAEAQEESSDEVSAAQLEEVDPEVVRNAIANAGGLASQGDEGSVSLGVWTKGSIVKGKYTELANGMYQYVYLYRFTLDEKIQVKIDYSSTQYSSPIRVDPDSGETKGDEFNTEINLLEIWDDKGTVLWGSKNKITTKNGKLTCSKYINLPAGDYYFWIGLAYKTDQTPYSGWFGSYQFKISKAPFKDVLSENWFYGVVNKAVKTDLMSGYSGKQAGWFGSQDKLERGQVAVILWKMAGRPKDFTGAKTFSDVTSDDYYYNAVCWASACQIVNGYENSDKFGPEDPVTREQLAIMMFKYARNVRGLNAQGSAEDYASMSDASSVADYAQSALGWCFKSKILTGSEEGCILPKGKATRAEAAKMLTRLYSIVSA